MRVASSLGVCAGIKGRALSRAAAKAAWIGEKPGGGEDIGGSGGDSGGGGDG